MARLEPSLAWSREAAIAADLFDLVASIATRGKAGFRYPRPWEEPATVDAVAVSAEEHDRALADFVES